MQTTEATVLHVFHEEQQTGPFPIATVREMLRDGRLSSAASVWCEGMADWQPIDAYLAAHPAPVASPPLAAVRVPARKAGPAWAEVNAAAQKAEPSDVLRVVRSLLAGGVAAVVAGGVWVALALGVGVQIGWLAWGVGALCGWSVSFFGRGNGVIFQLMAVGFSLLGIAIGKVGILLGGYFPFSLFDLLWILLAVASAWKTAGGGSD